MTAPPIAQGPRPISRLQWLLLYALLLSGVAVMWNRSHIPRWLVPKIARQQPGSYWALMQATQALGTSLRGRPLLLVGDSMVLECPLPHDRIVAIGMSAPEIAGYFEEFILGRQYEQIVLWPGSAHFHALHEDVASYVDAVVAMVAVAQEHAPAVCVITPMVVGPEAAAPVMTDEDRRAIHEAVRLLRARLPDVTIYDVEQLYAYIARDNLYGTLTIDGVHLTPLGYNALFRELGVHGVAYFEWYARPGSVATDAS